MRFTSAEIREGEGRQLALPGHPAISDPCPVCAGRLVVEHKGGQLVIWFYQSHVDCWLCLQLYHLGAEAVDEYNSKRPQPPAP